MSEDALSLFQAMRPAAPPVPNGDLRPATSQNSRDLHGLAMVPGSPEYRARIPAPPCVLCGEDHFPTRTYDHPWTGEAVQVHDEPVAASAVMRRPSAPPATLEVESSPTPQRRVALYVGRGDLYVVAVEQSPDWDAVEGGTFRVEPDYVLGLVKLARALDVKIVDKTGGDLLMLEQEHVSQHAQDHGRGAASPGGSQPRRPGPEPDRPQEALEAPGPGPD